MEDALSENRNVLLVGVEKHADYRACRSAGDIAKYYLSNFRHRTISPCVRS